MEGVDRLYNEDQICWGEWRARANMYEGKRSRWGSEGYKGATRASKATANVSFALP
jgi:hypothetical protein